MSMSWNSFDLNLLVVFDAIMQSKTLTRAGQLLGMSQPAVSHALARLRHMLKDDLFVRAPEGMLPTARAERMAGPVRAALQELQVTRSRTSSKHRSHHEASSLWQNNYAARAVIPGLVRRMARLAPSVVLDVRPIGMLHVLDQLDSGGAELALTAPIDGGDRFKCVGLMDDEYVAIMAIGNPVAVETDLSH
jgi:DNA-binding transcriptional LysR family regulator